MGVQLLRQFRGDLGCRLLDHRFRGILRHRKLRYETRRARVRIQRDHRSGPLATALLRQRVVQRLPGVGCVCDRHVELHLCGTGAKAEQRAPHLVSFVQFREDAADYETLRRPRISLQEATGSKTGSRQF